MFHGRCLLALAALAGCTDDPAELEEGEGVAALGGGTHDAGAITLRTIANHRNGLDTPRDLAFNPDAQGELWIVNQADDSVTLVTGLGTANPAAEHRVDPFALHFMEEVSSIAFGAATWSGSDALTFGTCQESRNTYNDSYEPDDFMGPTLWSADPDVFASSNEDAIAYLTDLYGFYTDLGSHLDMLHESPLCMGIAWQHDNAYWVFDGHNDDIVRYDFAEDHDVGWDDHSDGIIGRVTDLDVARVEGVPSHMDFDPRSGLLFVADTGNNRILALDPNTGSAGKDLARTEPGVDHHELDGVSFGVAIDGGQVEGMTLPSGLEFVEDLMLVTDHQTGTIFAFQVEGDDPASVEVTLVDWVETGRAGAIMGIAAETLDELYFVDATKNELVRVTAK